MDLEHCKQELIKVLKLELASENMLAALKIRKEVILKKMEPLLNTDVYSTDEFMIKKDIELFDYDLKDVELADYMKQKGTVLDKTLVKKAIRAGIRFTNVKSRTKLIVYKKRHEL